MNIGDVLVVRNIDEIESLGCCTEDLYEGDEYTVLSVDEKYLKVNIMGIHEQFTLEPSIYGLSWKSFFTHKEF